jgi:hypothetical protein
MPGPESQLPRLRLAKYCPEFDPRDPSTMWLIVWLLVLVAPTGLFVLRRYNFGGFRGFCYPF